MDRPIPFPTLSPCRLRGRAVPPHAESRTLDA